jgi:nicotinate-nucleotide pyrophosphorylase (carboxylating)
MDRKSLRNFTHKADNMLKVENSTYKQWVFRYTFLELEKDLGAMGDITSESVFTEKKMVKANIVAKENGVFAGREEIQYFLVDADAQFRPKIKGEFKVKFNVEDGQEIKSGDVLIELEAELHDLLAVERTVLNLIMRMSAIATMTRRIVNMLKDYDVMITPTRKALWGWIDRKAVVVGGGGSHRLNLSDAVLVKNTHMDIAGHDFDMVLGKIADANLDCRFVEIEVGSVDAVVKLAEAFPKYLGAKIKSVGVALIDNVSAADTKIAIEKVKELGLHDGILFEASGRINEKTVLDYAKTGVDIISMGCLTSGIQSLDMSLRIAK